MNAASAYLSQAQANLDRIIATQIENNQRAADSCIDSIAHEGLAHLFGTGHSRIFIEEI